MQVVLEGQSDHVLGWATMLGQGPQPEREALPDAVRGSRGEELQDSEGDGRDVDEALVGFDLAPRLRTDGVASPMQILIPRPPWSLLHGLHPEVVAEAREGLDQGLEGDLDLEAQAIGIQDLFGTEVAVCRHQDASATIRIDAEHETQQKAMPEEVATEIADMPQIPVQIDAGELKALRSLEEIAKLHTFAVLAWTSTSARPGAARRWRMGHGVRAHAADVMHLSQQESAHERGSGVVGVGNKQASRFDNRSHQDEHLVEERRRIRRRSLDAVLDLKAKRNGQDLSPGLHERTGRAPEVAHDVLGFGVVLRFLMQELDPGHLLPRLADLDPVYDMHGHATDADALRRVLDDLGPLGAQCLYAEGGGVEEMKEVVVLGRRESKAADNARDPEGLHAQREGPRHEDEPAECSPSPEDRAKLPQDRLDFLHQTHTPPPGRRTHEGGRRTWPWLQARKEARARRSRPPLLNTYAMKSAPSEILISMSPRMAASAMSPTLASRSAVSDIAVRWRSGTLRSTAPRGRPTARASRSSRSSARSASASERRSTPTTSCDKWRWKTSHCRVNNARHEIRSAPACPTCPTDARDLPGAALAYAVVVPRILLPVGAKVGDEPSAPCLVLDLAGHGPGVHQDAIDPDEPSEGIVRE